MPVIYRFFGIKITMYPLCQDHEPPHIHASYGEFLAKFNINTLEMTDGLFPNKQSNLVRDFIIAHKEELLEMWKNQNIYKIGESYES